MLAQFAKRPSFAHLPNQVTGDDAAVHDFEDDIVLNLFVTLPEDSAQNPAVATVAMAQIVHEAEPRGRRERPIPGPLRSRIVLPDADDGFQIGTG